MFPKHIFYYSFVVYKCHFLKTVLDTGRVQICHFTCIETKTPEEILVILKKKKTTLL